ncbi:asparagine synthase (glutamine-hydrolyzing) [Streptomyces sp. Vc74B-19]|uniref:asparagine synthase (glutamine-hydrolyzing) n=1 Tax=unclassified Streptomyces TaxID=2593676 RepID=UPI001BFC3663|nr:MULTISPECIES: asparagine synthase (glutamine-hydrolyzing) [unclassified Streptomyces]MBT3162713.1 asparagine synthase (glutamine-hydrolyzing) [Streptomyces sp. Vc74B-19]MCO4697535.1 asparagine synthase (glutamine-hydrolyzing) [Streptomyces sp. RO-S4]
MCGIVGWTDFTRDLSQERTTLQRMTDTMALRGPDAAGTWLGPHTALGHRRLSIIDLEGGTQPAIATAEPHQEPVVLVYSGEIYNFRELRALLKGRGHRFTTRSDTEVVLRSYLEWGASCVDHFNGMFAFAVWDARREELVLARDRIGIKPLYHYAYSGGILFASEPKGIMANPLFQPVVDEDSLPILFNARLALPGETPLRGMREVRPGHVLRFSRSGGHEYPYWRLVGREHRDDLDTTVATVRNLLEDIVDRQLVADVPRSAMLSGGLDSTIMSALANRRLNAAGEGPLHTFAVEFGGDENDFKPTELRPERDAPYARLASRHLGTVHHNITLQTDDVLAALPAARRARDLPSLGQFDTSMHLLFKAIREQSTVALSGEAADEVFGGYPWYHDERLVRRDRFPWIGDAPRLADAFAPDLHRRVRPADAEHDRYLTLKSEVPRLPGEQGLNARMREVMYYSLKGPLAYLLDRKDRMSMAVGLEVRVPYCDHRLIEYVWNVPWDMKNADGRWKSLLRLAFADVLPKETLDRPKSGYPGTHDPAYNAEVMRSIDKVLSDPSSPLHGVFDPQRVEALTQSGSKTMTWLNSSHLLLPILEVDTWMRDYNVSLA